MTSREKEPPDETLDDQVLPTIDAAVQNTIGRKLRETYSEIIKEDVPPKFLRLLKELKQKEKDPEEGAL